MNGRGFLQFLGVEQEIKVFQGCLGRASLFLLPSFSFFTSEPANGRASLQKMTHFSRQRRSYVLLKEQLTGFLCPFFVPLSEIALTLGFPLSDFIISRLFRMSK